MRILFIGTGDIGVPALELLATSPEHELIGIVTQPDKPAGRKQELLPPPVKEAGLRHHVPIFQPAKIREPSAIEHIRFCRPDVIVVMAYGQILPREVLLAPAIAIINLHASLLPRHRGAAPIQAALAAGDTESGITVMYVDEGLDTGEILLKKTIRIRRRETAGSLHERLAQLAPVALAEALELLEKGCAPRIPQDSSQATYAGKLTREKGLIDWKKSSLEIDRSIRAMNPWPAAYTTLPEPGGNQRKLKVFATILNRKNSGKPGEVLRADKHGILVGAGGGSVLLREIQVEGKKRMSARDFLLGRPIPPGTILGAP